MRVPVVRHSTRRRRVLRRRVLRAGGELLVTGGVVLLLLVAHQVWWTSRQARDGAERQVEALEREWRSGPGVEVSGPAHESRQRGGHRQRPATARPLARPRWSQAYAVLTIPRLHVRVPVAEGVGKRDVLNKGYVGHYPATQQPGQAGNFAVAGHRNTHGEPFRYVNRLRPGDVVEVETRTGVYTYAVDRTLPQTSAHDTGVIRSVPRSSVRPAHGYDTPGYYLTLTTCTPEYTSKYRLVVWARLSAMRPR